MIMNSWSRKPPVLPPSRAAVKCFRATNLLDADWSSKVAWWPQSACAHRYRASPVLPPRYTARCTSDSEWRRQVAPRDTTPTNREGHRIVLILMMKRILNDYKQHVMENDADELWTSCCTQAKWVIGLTLTLILHIRFGQWHISTLNYCNLFSHMYNYMYVGTCIRI